MTRLLITMAAALAAAQPTLGYDLRCAVDARTDAHQCIRVSEVRERDGIVTAPLYAGGPQRVRPTGFAAAANCRTQVLHLKDADGVTFGGGRFSDSAMAGQLGRALCPR